MKEILISSSVLILVLAALRHLLRGKVSRRLQYGLWLLVALRLLIPVQFGQSDYSVTALTEKLESESKPIQQLQQTLREPIAGPSRAELYDQLLNEYLQKSDNSAEPEVLEPVTPEIREQIESQVDEQITAPTLSEILSAVWIGGMGIMALWFVTANLSFLLRAKRDSAPWNGSAPVRVRISSNVPTPCLTGLLRPVIYLTPGSTLDENSLNHILTHELTHLRHGDHIWSLVRCVCLCVYWFDPLVWLAAILSKRDCELACDEAALKKLGDDQRIPYGKTLLATVTQSRSPAHILETATAMNETKKQLKERVNQIVKKPRTLLIAAVILILTAALAAGCAFAGSKPSEPSVTEPAATEPQPTEPTIPEPAYPTDPPSQMTEEMALTVAKEYLDLYEQYRSYGLCCDLQYVSGDMSQYLSDAQKALYSGTQLLVECCHNPEEVLAHMTGSLSPSLIDSSPIDRLFSDDEGNLYLIDDFHGNEGYSREITISYYSDERIIATVELFNIDNAYYGSQIVTLANTGDGFTVENFEWYNINIKNLPYSADTFAERRWEAMDLAMERFGISYIEFLYAGNSIVADVAKDYATLTAASVPWDAEAMRYRSLYVTPNGKLMLCFPIRGIGDISDPLSGFFSREFTAPEIDIESEACQWFFEELRQNTDSINAYAGLFLDAFYRQPGLCLENMTSLEDSAVSDLAVRIYSTLVEWDEYEQYTQFLASLSAGTAREARILTLLATPPESFTPPDDTLSIATKLIKKYRKYEILRIFCDYEPVYEDMSQYLTEKQKEEYWNNQYRITCCGTPEEIRAHIRRKLDLALIHPNYPDDELFYDDEGNLYLIVLPTDYAGYSNIRILHRSDAQIIAYADLGYDSYENSTAFILEQEDGEWKIRKVLQFDEHLPGSPMEEEAYRWLLEEAPDFVYAEQTDLYGRMLLDTFFQDPDTFLRHLSALDEDQIWYISSYLRQSLTSEEQPVYNRLLDAINAKKVLLTDAEQSALSILCLEQDQ